MSEDYKWCQMLRRGKQEFCECATLTVELEPGVNFEIYLTKKEMESFIEFIKTDNTKEASEIMYKALLRQR
jgi:hypothetical protein